MEVKRTLKRINERFRWPGMVKDVTNMVGCSIVLDNHCFYI